MSADENNLIWIDLEMTGLDPERDRIIEIATLVTDANLNILAEGPTIAVHQSDAQLALMDEWNVRTHTGSGLVERVKASTQGDREAELATIEFLKKWTIFANRSRNWPTIANTLLSFNARAGANTPRSSPRLFKPLLFHGLELRRGFYDIQSGIDVIQQLRIVFTYRNGVLLTVVAGIRGAFVHHGVVGVILEPFR